MTRPARLRSEPLSPPLRVHRRAEELTLSVLIVVLGLACLCLAMPRTASASAATTIYSYDVSTHSAAPLEYATARLHWATTPSHERPATAASTTLSDPHFMIAAEAGEGGIDASQLTMTRTVEQHLSEYAKDGTLARPYGNSPLTIQEIMRAGDPVPDPGGVPGALRWDVPGAVNGSQGTWQLVIDPQTNTILHFLFVRG